MGAYLSEAIQAQARALFQRLENEVNLILFGTTEPELAAYSQEVSRLLTEVEALSDQITLIEFDIEADAEIAAMHGVDKAPMFLVVGRDGMEVTDYGIRFVGLPTGREFSALVNDILLAGQRNSGLEKETRAFLAGIDQPVLLQVFTTPTCPYCPQAVVMAHQMAMESPWVTAEMIDFAAFPELAERYRVGTVPQTTINAGAKHVIGAVSEATLVLAIQETIGA